ncbi:hypothetical protein CDL12_27186 [Handroanthus impetiginosus]|uniref:B3 domain-containing protein n=1 Tax=Handroanthus impetiginosus TaxID=429701 RepID=A0A2G9G4S8_9LAMI|nr:hypothetical protein CDL12_27186 [Handroanthus impetiginosus]
MQARKTDKLMRLFGVNIHLSVTDYNDQAVDNISTSSGGEGNVSLPEEGLTSQESYRKGSEVSTSSDDHVDTSLRLSSGSSYQVARVGQYEKKGKLPDYQLALSFCRPDIAGPSNNYIMHGGPVLCPAPLRSFPPTSLCFSGGYNTSFYFSRRNPFQESNEKDTQNFGTNTGEGTSRNRGKNLKKSKKKEPSQESDDTGTLNSYSSRNNGKSRAKSVKRRGQDDDEKEESVKRRRSTIASHNTTEPIPTIEQLPQLLQVIESQNGSQPIFLYRKKLQESDIRKDQNRLFLTKSEELMKFLTDEERNSVYNTKEGLELCAVDPEANSYSLNLAQWGSLHMLVLKSQWIKLVQKNNVETGFWAEMWGYRCDGKVRLAVNFRKPAEEPEAQRHEGPNGIIDGGNYTV